VELRKWISYKLNALSIWIFPFSQEEKLNAKLFYLSEKVRYWEEKGDIEKAKIAERYYKNLLDTNRSLIDEIRARY